MKRVPFITAAVITAVLAVLSFKVAAQDFNPQERSFLTFSQSVELPGVTLAPGTYVFRLADSPSRNVVQVLTRDEKDVLGQWLFVQADRPQVSNETVVMFKESPEGRTPAVQYWYYPGERTGKEFVYPKDQAEKIAARTGQSVKSFEGAISADPSIAEVAPSAQSADTSALRDAPAAAQPSAPAGSLTGNRGSSDRAFSESTPREAVGTTGSVRESTRSNEAVGAVSDSTRSNQSVGTTGSSAQQETQIARAELPQTASPLPFSALIGLLSLVGALGTRAASRR